MPGTQTHTQFVRPPRTRWRRAVIGLAVVVLAIGLAWQEREPILQHVGAWWVVSDELTHADAVVVLGGDLDVRPFAAAALYKRGFASKILVANVRMGRAERLGLIPSHTELNRDILLKLGVPATAIATFGEDVSSTQEEAQALRDWALAAQAKSIIVPTELFAARRTRWIFDRALDPVGVDVVVHAYPPEGYSLANWWRHRYGLIDFNNEVLKYLYYRIQF
jgi:uncharacterized SAM-binding protein YcdF (DUF218 family)